LFAIGSDTVVATASSVTQQTNRKNRYFAAFTDVPAGRYLLIYSVGSTDAGSEIYNLTLATATFQPESESAAGLAGDYTLTVTVTDADTDAPIENATVTLSRTGERGAELTDDEGVAVLGLDAAAWSWIVRAAGYESRAGVIAIADDDVLAVELDGIVVDTPVDPNTATLRVTCIGEDSLIDPGAVVRIRMIEAPAGQEGFGYDGSDSTFTADSNGIAERLVTRGATYEIRREGTYKQWQKYVMPTDEDLIELDSFVQP
jgi:hypothetical protein